MASTWRRLSLSTSASSGGGSPPLREQFDHVRRNADRLTGIDERPLDRLLDPVAGISAETRAHRRVEALDCAEQAEVAFLDEILQREALAGVAAGDVYDEAQVGADHAIAGGQVAFADAGGQLLLFAGVEEGGLVDLAKVGFQRRL